MSETRMEFCTLAFDLTQSWPLWPFRELLDPRSLSVFLPFSLFLFLIFTLSLSYSTFKINQNLEKFHFPSSHFCFCHEFLRATKCISALSWVGCLCLATSSERSHLHTHSPNLSITHSSMDTFLWKVFCAGSLELRDIEFLLLSTSLPSSPVWSLLPKQPTWHGSSSPGSESGSCP